MFVSHITRALCHVCSPQCTRVDSICTQYSPSSGISCDFIVFGLCIVGSSLEVRILCGRRGAMAQKKLSQFFRKKPCVSLNSEAEQSVNDDVENDAPVGGDVCEPSGMKRAGGKDEMLLDDGSISVEAGGTGDGKKSSSDLSDARKDARGSNVEPKAMTVDCPNDHDDGEVREHLKSCFSYNSS